MKIGYIRVSKQEQHEALQKEQTPDQSSPDGARKVLSAFRGRRDNHGEERCSPFPTTNKPTSTLCSRARGAMDSSLEEAHLSRSRPVSA